MAEIERFTPRAKDGGLILLPSQAGAWVRFDDHRKQVDHLTQALTRSLDDLRQLWAQTDTSNIDESDR